MKRARLVALALSTPLAACGSCADKGPDVGAEAGPRTEGSVSAEVLPRCRADGARAIVPGEDVVVGDALLGVEGLTVGVVRRKDGARIASIVRANAELRDLRVIDLGPSYGDDPPPSPRLHDGALHVAWLVKRAPDAGAPRGLRELRFARVDGDKVGAPVGVVVQQADESTAFDVAWPLAAWDEDATIPEGKLLPERGVVRVQQLPEGTPRTVSPASSDAEGPKLAPKRGGGFWLAWLAQRPETPDAGARLEGAGDLRAYRWVELVSLERRGEAPSNVIKVTPDTGHVVSFDLVVDEGGGLSVVAQDESEGVEGGGARILRFEIDGDHVVGAELVDGGVGHVLADLVGDRGAGFVAWKDTTDRSLLSPTSAGGKTVGPPTREAVLDDARLLAASPAGLVYLTTGNELRRAHCAR